MRFSATLSVVTAFITIAQLAPGTVAYAQCHDISTYTTEWFLANTKPEWRGTSIANALFYTAGLSQRAQQFAKQVNNRKTTIWEVWPCQSYHIIGTRWNPLKCIMRDHTQKMTYFENMSRAFALKAQEAANVLHRDIEDPPMGTIWGRVELPALQDGGLVDLIIAIDAESGHSKLEWTRNVYDKVKDGFESTYQLGQKYLHGRELDEIEACSFQVDSKHPLY